MCKETYTEMLIHGYDCEFKIIRPSRELTLVGKELEKLNSKTIKLSRVELADAKRESENFLKNHYNLHKIYYGNNEELGAEFLKYDFKNIYQVNRIYKKIIRKIEPYQLPIMIDESKGYCDGQLNEVIPNCKDYRLLRIVPVVNDSITLGKTATNFTGGVITHEITHSQINYHKGTTKSYYNQEVISIFNQLLHNLEKGENGVYLAIDKFFRIIEIKDEINELNAYHDVPGSPATDSLFNITKYLESTLKAFMLFEIYLNSNNRIKYDILNHIQRIFDGKKTVEALLSKYNITLQKSSKLLQKKYLKGK